jgi:hypothetical protein
MHGFLDLIRPVVFAAALAVLQACGGGGGGTPVTTDSGNSTPDITVTVTGAATYAFVPTNAATGGLDYASTFDKPIRGATIEARSSTTDALLATTSSSDQGTYAFALPINTSYYLRVRAELIKTTGPSTWVVKVRDNTCAGALPCNSALEPLWAIDSGASFTGTTDSVRSIAAPSGWNATTHKYEATRPAAPFSILDTIYSGMKLVSAAQPTVNFPLLTVYWSPKNIATGNNLPIGEIGTSFFGVVTSGATITRTMYILGFDGNDTDEYDPSVIAHEYGHYLQSAFSSTGHSVGGQHGNGDKLDMTVAFSEGWGNAWSSMARKDPVYNDSFGAQQAVGGHYDLTAVPVTLGWYSEGSVEYVLYKLSQQPTGFAPIWAALTGPMKTSQNSLATIFSFAAAVRQVGNTTFTAAMNNILNSVNVYTGPLADQWGAGESNNGGEAGVLPIYNVLPLGGTVTPCFTRAGNKLGAFKYYRTTLPAAGLRTITANFSTGQDIDFDIFQNGNLIDRALSSVATSETKLINLSVGEVIIRVEDASRLPTIPGTTPAQIPPPTCASLTIN